MIRKTLFIPLAGDGGFIPSGNLPINVTENGTQQVEVTQYQFVTISTAVPNGVETLQVTQNGTYTPSGSNIGFSEVSVAVPQPSGTLQQTVTSNGTQTIDVTNYQYLELTVAVPLQAKTINTNGTFTPDQGYEGFSQVSVQVPASAVDSGTKYETISQNGTQTINVVGYANIELDVQVAGSAEPDYFWIENVDENDLQTLVQLGNDNTSYSNKEIYYSQDKTNWTRMSQSITVGVGDKVYFYGNNLQINNEGFIITGGDVNIGGDATCLLTRQGGQKYGYEYVFYHLFSGCTAIKSADDLIVPFVTIGQWGMNGMFAGCTGLEHARFAVNIINATSLCFGGIFINCTSLIDSPTFTCQSVSDRSFQYAFQNCRSLTSAPDLNTVTTFVSSSQFDAMFKNCTSLTAIPLMPNPATLASRCYQEMFRGCTSLTTIPSGLLPATTLANHYNFS